MRAQLLANADKPKKYKCVRVSSLSLFATSWRADRYARTRREYTEDESDIDDDWISQHEINLVVLEREKIRKKFEKENKKREEENEKPLKESELTDRLKAADELEKTLKSEKKKGWKETKMTEQKLVAAIEKMDERIQVAKTNALDKDEGKEISLGTSKIVRRRLRFIFSLSWSKLTRLSFARD